jgi:hypothetical protein
MRTLRLLLAITLLIAGCIPVRFAAVGNPLNLILNNMIFFNYRILSDLSIDVGRRSTGGHDARY